MGLGDCFIYHQFDEFHCPALILANILGVNPYSHRIIPILSCVSVILAELWEVQVRTSCEGSPIIFSTEPHI